MNRYLQYLNLLGIGLLAMLCLAQWHVNRRLNLQAGRWEKTHWTQQAQLTEKEASIQGYAADLDGFRAQLTRQGERVREAEAKVASMELQLKQNAAQRAQLMTSVTNWAAAVAARDERLTTLREQSLQMARDRDAAIVKFNELAVKYNAVIAELNEARARRVSTGEISAPVPAAQ